jgi:dTDP-4-amino-4,6-dideoxygalactose transaminase
MKIPFNKPYLTGKETTYIKQAVDSGKISGDGMFTKKCHQFFENNYNFPKVLLTTSCTDALEMAAILLDIKEGDEVIAPSFTFVSTVNAFVLRGAKIVFADSENNHPNIDADTIEALITPKTKAIIPVHYAGFACNMDKIMDIANRHNLFVVEDAAQAIDSYYINSKGEQIPLGSIGHLAAFSFHETKNIISGEGGMLVINDARFFDRAEIIREKGTNRTKFFRGEVDKYGWVDIGSSYLPSDIIAAFLFAQLENIEDIQKRRKKIWNHYYNGLETLQNSNKIKLPLLKSNSTNNAHMFYIECKDLNERTKLIEHLKSNNVNAVFHYLSLHKSPFYASNYNGVELINSDSFTNRLLRLPFYYELTDEQIKEIITLISDFYA